MEKMKNNRYCNLYDVEYLLSKDGANYKVLEYFINNGLVVAVLHNTPEFTKSLSEAKKEFEELNTPTNELTP
ncbi:T3SS effector OspC family protein [Shigella flexneri]|nr:T3SS effector OspC family protein [Shigella flexneri]